MTDLKKIIGLLSILGIVFVLISCCSCRKRKNKIENIDVGIRNTGNRKIYGAYVKLGEYKTVGGTIIPKTDSVHVYFNHPITEEAEVHFKIEDKNPVTKNIPLKSVMPKDISGDLVIMFDVNSDDGEISVGFYQFKQIDGRAKLVTLK